MTDSHVQLRRQDGTAIISLNRPDRRNTISQSMWEALDDIVQRLNREVPSAVVITGDGSACFCAGQDVNIDNPQIKRLSEALASGDRTPASDLIMNTRRVLDGLVSLPVPVIAAINGDAYGGGAELATRCDLRVMDPRGRICFSEVKLGLMPDWGGGVALTRLVGPSRAADLVLTGRPVSAQEALHIGLINRISPSGECLDTALQMAGQIAKNGPRAVRAALKVIRRSLDMPREQALTLEATEAISLIMSGECLHGISAFFAGSDATFPDP